MLVRTTLRPRRLWLAAHRQTRLRSDVPLISIKNGTFYKKYPTEKTDPSNPPLISNWNFTLPAKPGPKDKNQQVPHWAIIGPAGRTDVLDILRGQHICVPPSQRSYPYLSTDEVAEKDPRLRSVSNAIQYIGFSGEGSEAIGGTRGAYLSARYESHREETDWTVEQYLRGQTSLNPMEGEEHGTVHDEEFFSQVTADLHLEKLLDMPVQNLSNGQTRRTRIAKALLKKPELLLLDEPFMGLDPATVRSISGLLHKLAMKSSPRLVLALRPQDHVPEWITNLMVLGHNNQVLVRGLKENVNASLDIWAHIGKSKMPQLGKTKTDTLQRGQAHMESGALDPVLLRDLVAHRITGYVKDYEANFDGEPVIEMEGVHVKYGDKVVLGDWTQKIHKKEKQGLHWRVRRGQRWAILGSNGSGKTTLLSMITSDHPQAYAQPVKLFGRSRLPEKGKPGISLFELQSRMGHSSPEVHAFFPRQLTIRQALESAFAETFLSKPKLTVERDEDISALLNFWRPELDPNYSSELPKVSTKDFPQLARVDRHTREKKYVPIDELVGYADELQFGQLTVAQQRIVLFLRALVHKPDIVILDEAFSGLSATQRDKCLRFIDMGERPNRNHPELDTTPYHYPGLTDQQALLMISHVPEEIPDSVRYYMRLPSDPGDGSEPLDFRFGMLQQKYAMRSPEAWKMAWSPPSEFEKKCRRTWRRQRGDVEIQDMSEFEWWSI